MSAVLRGLRGLRTQLWVLRMLVTSRMLVPMSPAKYVRLVRVLRRQGGDLGLLSTWTADPEYN